MWACEFEMAFLSTPKQFIVAGRIVGSIIYRTEPLTVVNNMSRYARDGTLSHRVQDPAVRDDFLLFSHPIYSILRSWVEVSQWCDYPTGESTMEALQRTLIMDDPKSLAEFAKERTY